MSNIRDVAKLANCSIATVSRVLSQDDSFSISEIKKQEIYDAVNKLNYTPRNYQKRINIGCIMSITVDKYSDPFFTSILSAMEEECNNVGATISMIRKYNELQNPRILQEMFDANLQGIIIMEKLPDELFKLIENKIPNILFIDNQEVVHEFDGIGFDHTIANWQVMNHLIDCGYRRIALISGSDTKIPLDKSVRMLCYREALRRNNIPYDESLVKDCNWDMSICEKQVKEVMNLDNPPDAIFAGSDSLASCILGTLYSMHYICPDDVGVIGFNNLPTSVHMIPPLTTINVPTYDIGIAAIHRMMEMIKGKNINKRKILFPTKLVERESTRRVK